MQPYGGSALGGLTWGILAPYGSYTLTETSPPQSFSEPLTLAEVKSYLTLPDRDPADPAEDYTLSGFISAAREVAEVCQGRDLVQKQWDLAYDYFWKYQFQLRDPLVTVDLVRYRDANGNYTTLAENTDYQVDTMKHPGIITPKYNTTWPTFVAWPSSAVLIRFTSGYASTSAFWTGDAGQRLKVGMLELISAWYNNRLPFDATRAIVEYPFGLTFLLSLGALQHVG